MTDEDFSDALSEEAKDALNELTDSIPVDDFSNNFINLMKKWKKGVIPEVSDTEIKNELQGYAKHMLAESTCSAYQKLPEHVAFDDFLAFLMKNTGKTVRRDRFQEFVEFLQESKCHQEMELLQIDEKHKVEFNARRVNQRMEDLEKNGVPKLSQCELQEPFEKWQKSKGKNNAIREYNQTRKCSAEERRIHLENLLPKKNDQEGLTKKQLQKKASNLYVGLSRKTFDRDLQNLTRSGRVHKQKNGKYRIEKKASDH